MPAEHLVRTVEGDTLDAALWRERGLGPDNLAPVLAANPGLAGAGTVLPIGSEIRVPATAPAAATRPLVQLWD